VFAINAWNDKAQLLATAFVCAVMAMIAAGGASLGTAFILLLEGTLWGGTYYAASSLISGFINVGGTIVGWRSWINGLEIALDLVFAVIAYARYEGRI
jgi:hypothetical protein